MKPSESRIQADCVRWYNNKYCLAHHEPRNIIFMVPNEGQQRKMNEGVLAGVSDLVVIHYNKILFIEMKTEKGKQRPKQIEFEERVNKEGLFYCVCRSLEEFKKVIEGEE